MKKIIQKLQILILRFTFQSKESSYYIKALKLKDGKKKVFQAAKKLADENHEANGKRYYVIDDYDNSGQFVVMNSNEINSYKKAGIFKKNLSFNQLAQIASYQTA
jgi:hypothetical protein